MNIKTMLLRRCFMSVYKVTSITLISSPITSYQCSHTYELTAVECHYKECEYHEWTTWSATCGITAQRSRTLRKAEDKMKKRYGGCAGLPVKCQNKETESQQLKSCSCKLIKFCLSRDMLVLYFLIDDT